ncbi:MAG: hypothetical protein LLG97_17645 [Deltaproteobacteria bacterium]|nr:hypothetical protein [Deltaproteobacteria bacterium]
MTIVETIKIRKSCRTYSDRAIEPDKLAELGQFLGSNTQTLFGSKVRFLLIDFDELEAGELKDLTTYGVVKGARQFIVGSDMPATGDRSWTGCSGLSPQRTKGKPGVNSSFFTIWALPSIKRILAFSPRLLNASGWRLRLRTNNRGGSSGAGGMRFIFTSREHPDTRA